MSVKAFRLTGERYLEPCRVDDVAVRAEHRPACWIDVHQDGTVPLEQLLRSLNLHPLAVDACLDASPMSRLVSYGKSLVIGLPTHTTWDAADRTFLFIVCLPGVLVTIHRDEVPTLTHVCDRYSGAMRFHGDNTSAILYQLLDGIIDEDMAFTLRTREEIDHVDELRETYRDELPEQTLRLKRQLARLAAAFEDQLYCVASLQTIESDAFHAEGLRDYFRDAVSHLEHASRSIGRQLAHLDAVQQEYQLHLQDKTNDRLRLLTIISTIFIPLTLISGIYGMNFRHMPELEWDYGYFGVLGVMLTIALAMLWGFRRAGWFR